MLGRAMQKPHHLGGRLFEVDRRQACARPAFDGLLVFQNPLPHALGEAARRLPHASADEIDDRFRKGDLAALVENVLRGQIVGHQEQGQVSHRFRGGSDLHDVAQQVD